MHCGYLDVFGYTDGINDNGMRAGIACTRLYVRVCRVEHAVVKLTNQPMRFFSSSTIDNPKPAFPVCIPVSRTRICRIGLRARRRFCGMGNPARARGREFRAVGAHPVSSLEALLVCLFRECRARLEGLFKAAAPVRLGGLDNKGVYICI